MNSILIRFNKKMASDQQLEILNTSEKFKVLGIWYEKKEQTITYPFEDVSIRAKAIDDITIITEDIK